MGRISVADALSEENLAHAVEAVSHTWIYFEISAYSFVPAKGRVQVDRCPPLESIVGIAVAFGAAAWSESFLGRDCLLA